MSTAVDHEYVIALLHNRTIEFHRITNQSLVHLIHLPESIPDPRSLLSVFPRNLTVPSSPSPTFSSCQLIDFPLHNAEVPTKLGSRPSTPPPQSNIEEPLIPGSIPITCRHLLISRNSVASLQPISLLERVEHAIQHARFRKAISMVMALPTSSYDNQSFIAYTNLKVGLRYLFETQFQEAGACFAVACAQGCDPRLIINLWPEFRLKEWEVNQTELQTWLEYNLYW